MDKRPSRFLIGDRPPVLFNAARNLRASAPVVGGALCVAWLLCAAPARAEDWERVGEQDGVRLYLRRVAGSPIKEVRADGVIEAAPEQVMAVLGDISAYPKIMPPTESARLLRKEGGVLWYYMIINPPWISRRDYCIRIEQDRQADGKLRSGWAIDNVGCPAPQAGMHRIQRNQGSWVLTPVRGGQATHVVYQAHTEPGGAVPAWMVNLATARSLPRVFQSLRAAATSPRYAAGAKVTL